MSLLQFCKCLCPSPKKFIRPFPDLADDHAMVPRQLRHVIDWDTDGVGNGFILQMNHLWEEVKQVILCQNPLMMFCSYPGCHLARIPELVWVARILAFISYRKGL